MTTFDEKLARMEYLMEYKTPKQESASSGIEYHTEGADGKVYGIIKEGNTYYIKTTAKGKENLKESYDYIGGFNYRNENGFKSYNKACGILEQKMIALNEQYGIHKDVSVVDMDRSKKALEGLTEAARKELDRVKMIMENSVNIGNHGDPESKGHANPSQTEKLNDPFNEKAKAQLDKDDVKSESDPKKANSGYTDASKNVELQMTSDKAPSKNDTNSINDLKNTEDDLDGKSVAAEKPKGGKAVMVNEGLLDGIDDDVIETPMDQADLDEPVDDEPDPMAAGLVGTDDEEDDLDTLMEQFNELLCGDDETLTGPHGKLDVQTVDEVTAASQSPKSEEKQEALDGPKGSGKAISWDKLDESTRKNLSGIIDGVVNRMMESRKAKKMTLSEKIEKMVRENLDAWGDHPRYGEEPMTTPADTEVLRGTADKDWNDDSAKGSERYGKKIGNGKPFDEVVKMLTDSVIDMIKESQKKK